MQDRLHQTADAAPLRAALDWTVFAIGAASLIVAITATVVLHGGERHSEAKASAVEAAG